MAIKTREEWLKQGIILLTDLFKEMKHKVPKGILVSCGFPSTGAFAKKRQRIGECWYPKGKDPHNIFISPVLNDPARILDVLTHELVHSVAGPKAGHRNQFRRIAIEVGLTGPMRSTIAGDELRERLNGFSRALGKYPHCPVSKAGLNGRKRQVARMMKVVCPSCGYLARITRVWIEVGLPVCPCGAEMVEGSYNPITRRIEK